MNHLPDELIAMQNEQLQRIQADKLTLYQQLGAAMPDAFNSPIASYQLFYIWIPEYNYSEPCLQLKELRTKLIYRYAYQRLCQLGSSPTKLQIVTDDGRTLNASDPNGRTTVRDGMYLQVKFQ